MVNLALDVHADTAIHHNSKQGPVHVHVDQDKLNLQFSCTHRNYIIGAARTSAGTSWDTGRAHLQSCHGIQDSVDYWDTWRRRGRC